MKYRLEYEDGAKEGMRKLKKSGDKQAMKKLDVLIEEIVIHPRKGTGHPEQLRHKTVETWSREITKKHRLVYKIRDEIVTVTVVQTYGHYGDK